MTSEKPRSFMDLDSWKRRNTSKHDSADLDKKVKEYSISTEKYASSENSYFSQGMEIEHFKGMDLIPDFIRKVNSNSREISKNNRNLERKIKAELSGINLFKKGEHFFKTITSRNYRGQTADELIKRQLEVCANFRDLIKMIYSNLNNELNKNVKNLDNLEGTYFKSIAEREQTKRKIQKSGEDYKFLREAHVKDSDFIGRKKLEISITNANRHYRKGISRLDELNHMIINNIEEREFDYNSEIIFERYEGAFRKIYETAESELRKIDRIKGLYLNAIKGGKVIKNLEKSFEDIFSSLRLMDNVLLKGVVSLLESSSNSKGRIRELRDEKSRNSQILLRVMKDNFTPNAQQLNALVENYVQDETKGGMDNGGR